MRVHPLNWFFNKYKLYCFYFFLVFIINPDLLAVSKPPKKLLEAIEDMETQLSVDAILRYRKLVTSRAPVVKAGWMATVSR